MARPPRFEYPGAVYHLMARGDGGKAVFETDDDRKVFLARLGEVCGSRGWRVHAWVLMSNHFHLLLETPEANLVSGMKWLIDGASVQILTEFPSPLLGSNPGFAPLPTVTLPA